MLIGYRALKTHQEGVNHPMHEYTNFYGFSENPFEIAPDPRFFLLSENNREALASLNYGIKERKGFILISGMRGIGKTSLIRYVLNNLDKKVKGVIIDQPGIGIEKLLIEVFTNLGLPPSCENKTSLIQQLNAYLIQQLRCDENLAIFIDEAQNLSKETMEELRLLSNLETSTSKLLQIILVGQPEIKAKLDSKELRQFKQRIVLRSRIGRLTEEESRWYIDYRLRLAGSSSSKVFTPEAVSLIYRYSKGIPLSINIQCNKAFGIGYRLSKKRIDSSIVRRVNKSLFKKICYAAPVLGCLVVLIILLGREYTKSLLEERVLKPSVHQSMVSGKMVNLTPQSRTDLPL
jgi:general secretion pathway protein A